MTAKTKATELNFEELDSVQGGNGFTLEKNDRLGFAPFATEQNRAGSSKPQWRESGGLRWIEGVYVFDEQY